MLSVETGFTKSDVTILLPKKALPSGSECSELQEFESPNVPPVPPLSHMYIVSRYDDNNAALRYTPVETCTTLVSMQSRSLIELEGLYKCIFKMFFSRSIRVYLTDGKVSGVYADVTIARLYITAARGDR